MSASAEGPRTLQHDLVVLLDASAERMLDQVGAPLAHSALVVGIDVAPATAPDRPVLVSSTGPGDEALCGYLTATLGSMPGNGVTADDDRTRAVEAALKAAPGTEGCRFFVGQAAVVDDYALHPVLSLDVAAVGGAVPPIVVDGNGFMARRVSLVDEAIVELLRATTSAVSVTRRRPVDPSAAREVATEVARRAALRLVEAVILAAGTGASPDLFEAVEALASTAYEGRASQGAVVLAAPGHDRVDVVLRLRHPVSVQNRRQFRKLLELSGPRLDLLTDGMVVYGLGRISPPRDGSATNVFRFEVVKQGEWRLTHRGEQLLEMDHGHPRVPRPPISFARFQQTLHQVFPDTSNLDSEAIWHLAQTVSIAPYGAMLVVSSAAEQEAARLAAESIVIEPTRVNPDLLESMTRIDGAVLLTPDAVCHGVAVILDGIATGTGDPGRGARYNSALRYSTTAPAPCVIVIVSEDGMIDLHPPPEREMTPGVAQHLLDDLERLAAEQPVDLNRFFATSGQLRLLTSHLSPMQCQRANRAWRLLAARHEERTGLPMVVVPFLPRRRDRG